MVDIREIRDFSETVTDNIEKVIVGKRDVIELVMVALLCEGHLLFEDMPGTGKTMLARAVAVSLGLDFHRIQFTPDLLPNDVVGVSVFNQQTLEFEFRPGPAFSHVLLTDEINRATPRTQSALLEAMGEQQISVDGVSRTLPRPFLVMATQNPIEYEGTFPLPEAQLDRFFMRLSLGYASADDERTILHNLEREHPIDSLEQVVDGRRLLRLQQAVWDIHVDDTVRDYLIGLVQATRDARRVDPRRQYAGHHRAIQGRAGVCSAAKPRLRDPGRREAAGRLLAGPPPDRQARERPARPHGGQHRRQYPGARDGHTEPVAVSTQLSARSRLRAQG